MLILEINRNQQIYSHDETVSYKGGFGQVFKRHNITELPEKYIFRATPIIFPHVTCFQGREVYGLFLAPKNPSTDLTVSYRRRLLRYLGIHHVRLDTTFIS